MYHSWLDRWDERRARRGEEGKETTDFVLDAERAFPGAKKAASIEEFCVLADSALADPDFFEEPSGSGQGFEREEGWLRLHAQPESRPDDPVCKAGRMGRAKAHSLAEEPGLPGDFRSRYEPRLLGCGVGRGA